ncbi:glycosyl hydrolase family 35 [Rathayibacter sp. PhB93]|uniref:beta-galactosidase n=1 Tax=unclassified Rathayibacter TaxID=2609250 RepID=UPI000F4663FF|nr:MULTISPECIES: beta-galactosidase [unclassified Rathayibacter]ROQ04342.1 glycosyl hydrolase family 35 [Rathayibacter sp. PhB93]TDQ13180.1 glycosyl hydrolase family 35 [Rathayibacter sp. PhB1]
MTAARQDTVSAATVRHLPWAAPAREPAMSNAVDRHDRWRLTSRSVLRDGRPFVPVSGELHYSRVPRARWEERLRLMRASGVTVVAFYVIWIHHEEVRGERRFDGDLDVGAFVDLCAEIGLDVVLRVGPWCHGEVRNGGFPDWVQAAEVEHRTDDPGYLALVRDWFDALGGELASRCGPGSNVVAIQIENEIYDQPEHIRTLKGLAREAGLTAPIWTSTGWGGADLPLDEVLPLFGGYADGFWVESDSPWDSTFRDHFFFSHQWDDPGIGADVRGATTDAVTPRAPSLDYPPATCELGGGMATAYHRRPAVQPLDIAAVAHTKIGNGSAWQGYYMYAGGTNPRSVAAEGLQESQATGYPNDLPRFDYDFRAPIGASGRPSPTLALLRRQHAFLEAFGEGLADMPSTLPDELPSSQQDTDTLRWALRSDGASGFVFVTWHQPHEPLPEHPGVVLEVGLDDEVVRFPSVSTPVPAGTLAVWPVRLTVGGVRLDWATATPLTLLDGAEPTLVLVAAAGVVAELAFAEGTRLEVDGERRDGALLRLDVEEPVLVRAQGDGGACSVLILSAEAGEEASVLVDAGSGERRLVLSEDPVWLDGAGRIAGDVRAGSRLPRVFDPEGQRLVPVAGSSASMRPETEAVEAPLLRASDAVPVSYGESAGRASAPRDADFAAAAAHRLELPETDPAAQRRELEIHWAGDVARILVGGEVVADQFWDGGQWVLDLDELGADSGDVVLEILPMSPDARIGLTGSAEERRRRDASPLLELGPVVLAHWYRWTED